MDLQHLLFFLISKELSHLYHSLFLGTSIDVKSWPPINETIIIYYCMHGNFYGM